jgi:hypothetical protein
LLGDGVNGGKKDSCGSVRGRGVTRVTRGDAGDGMRGESLSLSNFLFVARVCRDCVVPEVVMKEVPSGLRRSIHALVGAAGGEKVRI